MADARPQRPDSELLCYAFSITAKEDSMKKTLKKLALAKETVRDLDELTSVQGGATDPLGFTDLSCTAYHCPRYPGRAA